MHPNPFVRPLVAVLLATTLATSLVAWSAETTPDTRPKEPWWPSPWGPEDEAGASNRMTPQKVLRATGLIETGQVHRLGREYVPGMPMRQHRHFKLTIPAFPTWGPSGGNRMIYNVDMVSGELGQVGTQMDGLAHIGMAMGEDADHAEMRYYNGFTAAEMRGPYGFERLGVEKVKPFFTRGLLFDVTSLRGRPMERGEAITVADVEALLAQHDLDPIEPGDVVLFYTGWDRYWLTDNDKFNDGAPGVGLELAKWLAAQQVALVGSDTWNTGVSPDPDTPHEAAAVHLELIAKNGIFIQENLDLHGLLENGVFEFAYIFNPVPFKGASGSPGSPIAVQ